MLHTIIDRLDRIENKLNNKATDQYIDINQASVFTSLSVSTLRRYVARGELKWQFRSDSYTDSGLVRTAFRFSSYTVPFCIRTK